MRRIIPIVSVLCVALSSWTAVAGAATKSAAQILELSVANMKVEGSFHYASTSSIGGKVALTLAADSALTYGTQTENLGGGIETTRLIGTKLFIFADATAYDEDFDLPKSKLANRWVEVPASNKNYGSIADAILVKSVMQQLLAIGKVKYGGTVTLNGQAAYALERDAGTSGSEVIYVSEAAPHLPIALTIHASSGGRKIVNKLVFSKWGEKFRVPTPPSFVVATQKTLP
jgi:hypothetical protein